MSTWLAGFFEKNIGGESLGRGAWKSEFRASSHLAAALNDRVSTRADVVAHNANAHHRLIADATPGWEVPFKKVKTKQGGRLIVRSRRRSRRVARGKETRVDRPPSSRVGARISRGRTTGASAKPASRVPGWKETEGTRALWSFRRESTGKSVIDWFTRSPSCLLACNWQCSSTKIDFGSKNFPPAGCKPIKVRRYLQVTFVLFRQIRNGTGFRVFPDRCERCAPNRGGQFR